MLLRMLTQALCTTEAAGYLRGEVWESNKFWHLKMIIYLPAGLAQEASEVEAQLEALAGVGDLEVVVTGGGELGEQLLLLHGEGLGQHVRHWSVPLVHRGLKHLVETRPLVADLEQLGEGGEVTELLCEHGHVLPRHRGVIQDVEISISRVMSTLNHLFNLSFLYLGLLFLRKIWYMMSNRIGSGNPSRPLRSLGKFLMTALVARL